MNSRCMVCGVDMDSGLFKMTDGTYRCAEHRLVRVALQNEVSPEEFDSFVEAQRDRMVNHPPHYGGDTTYEVIKVIDAWDLGFSLGNCVKYIARAGKKDPAKELEDLEKARFYLEHRIKQVKGS